MSNLIEVIFHLKNQLWLSSIYAYWVIGIVILEQSSSQAGSMGGAWQYFCSPQLCISWNFCSLDELPRSVNEEVKDPVQAGNLINTKRNVHKILLEVQEC